MDAVLDLDRLKEMTSGDAELAAEALGIFRSQTEVWGRMLDASAGAEQWADACHAIKGAANSVGLLALGEVCARGEKLGRSEKVSPAEAGVMLSEVKDRMGEAIEAAADLEHRLMLSRSFEKLPPPRPF
jgi:HPt (histidine-containing phosphotransfer) domain-containing protein